MAVAGIVATSLLGISWAPSPARWGHHHSGITSRGPGGGPSVSHHAAARALEGPDGAPVPGPPGSGHHWHRGGLAAGELLPRWLRAVDWAVAALPCSRVPSTAVVVLSQVPP